MDSENDAFKRAIMPLHWHDYQRTGDKMALVHALKNADFYGHPEIAAEIERILVETFQLSGSKLKSSHAQFAAPLMFQKEMKKPKATKKRAYETIGRKLNMEAEAVRMMLTRLKKKD